MISLLREEQSGFRTERSCTDAILETTISIQKPVFLHFIDIQKHLTAYLETLGGKF